MNKEVNDLKLYITSLKEDIEVLQRSKLQAEITAHESITEMLKEVRVAHRMYGIALCEMYQQVDKLFRDRGVNVLQKEYEYRGIKISLEVDNFDKGEFNASLSATCECCGGPLSPPEACTCGPECLGDYVRGREGSGNKAGHQLKANIPEQVQNPGVGVNPYKV